MVGNCFSVRLRIFLRHLRLHHIAGAFPAVRQGSAVHHIQRVDNVTLGFGHLHSLRRRESDRSYRRYGTAPAALPFHL